MELLDASLLERLYPRWLVWRSDESGQWWAARRDNITTRQKEAGWEAFLSAECLDRLAQLLADQAALTGAPA